MSFNYNQPKNYIHKIIVHYRWMFANIETFSQEEHEQRSDEANTFVVKLMAELQLPTCSKYQALFMDYKQHLKIDILVEVVLKKLLKASYQWNTRTVSDIDLLVKFIANPHRDLFDTLPELGVENSPFTDFLLAHILMSGIATPMCVYQQLKLVENKSLYYRLSNLYTHPEKEIQIQLLKNEGVEFLEEFLSREQESFAFSKQMDGRESFNNEDWEGAIQSFRESANLSDSYKPICYPFICICYLILKMNIASEEYLYKSTEYFNIEDGESSRLYGLALAGHGEFAMGKQIFIKAKKGNPWQEENHESYLQLPAVKEILDRLMEYDIDSLTFLQ